MQRDSALGSITESCRRQSLSQLPDRVATELIAARRRGICTGDDLEREFRKKSAFQGRQGKRATSCAVLKRSHVDSYIGLSGTR